MTLALLTLRGKSWDVPLPGEEGMEDLAVLAPLAPNAWCRFWIMPASFRFAGCLAAPSEEPYSSEDKRLLDSVASQAVSRLKISGSRKNGRADGSGPPRGPRHGDCTRSAIRLFPQFLPPLQTLQYTGTCIQARWSAAITMTF